MSLEVEDLAGLANDFGTGLLRIQVIVFAWSLVAVKSSARMDGLPAYNHQSYISEQLTTLSWW